MCKEIDFNYDNRTASNMTVASLLKWISALHGEMTNEGLLPGSISDEMHLQMMVLAAEADHV